MQSVHLFVSYAHADEPEKPGEGEVKWLSFVIAYLQPAVKQGTVDIWIDRLMRGGDAWDLAIERKLRECDIFVLLVSRNSLSSDYVLDKEIAIIRNRQNNGEDVHFYPLLLTPTPKVALNLVRDKNLRPRDAIPFSNYQLSDRYQHMSEAADEIAAIADEIAARKKARAERLAEAEGGRRTDEERRAQKAAQSERTAREASAPILLDDAKASATPPGGEAPDRAAPRLAFARDGKNWSFRAFLSHRYKSPRVNEYFFSLFEGIGIPLFQVDEGIKTTCVTRLERMVRDSEGFIGLYPFPSESNPNAENLREASRYFRLELDIAQRAGKPAISFIDERYGAVVRPAPSIVRVPFRDAEVVLGARMPAEEDVKLRITEFCNRVEAARAYGLARNLAGQDRTKVGILLPPDNGCGAGYSPEHISLIEEEIQRVTPPREAVRMQWPPMLDSQFEAALEEMDWVVVDLDPISTACGIVSYLHGRFTPMLRLCRVTEHIADESRESQFENTLYGRFEVGYRKDIVRWTDEANLKDEIDKRIGLINFKSTFFATRDEALKYFRKAALRNEAVFVSYRGADRAQAGPIIEAFKRKFQVVFDYAPADERSIPAGTNWIEEIFRQIATMPLGAVLLSPDYLESGNCRHEMNEMIAQRDSGRMRVVPIRLREAPLPPAIRAIQYLRTENYENADQLVAAFIEDIDRAKSV